MLSILLVHHTPYHFEVTLSFEHLLRSTNKTSIWSNYLHVRNRMQIIEQKNICLYSDDASYDLLVVMTSDVSTDDLPDPIRSLLTKTPTLWVDHDFRYSIQFDKIYLLPLAPTPCIPINLGITCTSGRSKIENRECRFLVQGNVDARRSYDALGDLVTACPDGIFDVVGSSMNTSLIPPILKPPRVEIHFNLDEMQFHNICHRNHFVLPLIDPERFPRYFESAFTTSVLVGFTHLIPFIAHQKLFDMYGLVGLSYTSDVELRERIDYACNMGDVEYNCLIDSLREARQEINARNIVAFERCAARLGIGQTCSRLTSIDRLFGVDGLHVDRDNDSVSIPVHMLRQMLIPTLHWVEGGHGDGGRVTLGLSEFLEVIRPWLQAIPVDEGWYKRKYLASYPAEADAKEYFVKEGYALGHLPQEVVVDEEFYREQYPDVAEAIQKGWHSTSQAHFEDHGFIEGRRPNRNWLAWQVYSLRHGSGRSQVIANQSGRTA